MNPGVLFLPIFRASTTAYLLGLVVLALFDFYRMRAGLDPSIASLAMVAIWFFTFSLLANRRRYVGRSAAFALLPVALAALAKILTALVMMMVRVYEAMMVFAAENGVDTEDPVALNAAVSDPGFMQAFQMHLETQPEMAEQLVAAAAIPSFIAFWLVMAGFIPWYAQLKRRGGSVADLSNTPSLYEPEPVQAPEAEPEQAGPEPVSPQVEDSAGESEDEAAPEADASDETQDGGADDAGLAGADPSEDKPA